MDWTRGEEGDFGKKHEEQTASKPFGDEKMGARGSKID